MPTPPKKDFDAVEMSRRLRIETGKELAGLTVGELVERLNAPRFDAERARVYAEHNPTSSAEVVRENPPAP
jgi:hypothetical protein